MSVQKSKSGGMSWTDEAKAMCVAIDAHLRDRERGIRAKGAQYGFLALGDALQAELKEQGFDVDSVPEMAVLDKLEAEYGWSITVTVERVPGFNDQAS